MQNSPDTNVEITVENSKNWIDYSYEFIVQMVVESNVGIALVLAIALTHVTKIVTPMVNDFVTQKYPIWHGYCYMVSIICGIIASLIFLKDDWHLAIIIIFINGLIIDTLPRIPPYKITSVFRTSTDRSFDPKTQE